MYTEVGEQMAEQNILNGNQKQLEQIIGDMKEHNSKKERLEKLSESVKDISKELDNAQKSWLTYKEKQCGDFTLAEAGSSSGQAIFDLSCQSNLLKSRINYLKSITLN